MGESDRGFSMTRRQLLRMIGVTAGEAENPTVVLPRATNSIILRIMLFYIGSLIVILALVPWNQLRDDISPFVYLFEKMGLPAAAAVINLVVITAAMSSCNSGVTRKVQTVRPGGRPMPRKIRPEGSA